MFFREAGVQLEGIASFTMSNATTFRSRGEVLSLVADGVQRRNWSPTYSRNLLAGPLRWDGPIRYKDLEGRFLYLDVQNHRPDAAALNTVARLEALRVSGREKQPSPNRSPLKVTGQAFAFQQSIWPESHGAFDLLCVSHTHGSRVYLNSALDVMPTPLLFDAVGEHRLIYEVFSPGFDRLRIYLRLTTGPTSTDATAAILPEEDAVEDPMR